MTVQRSSLKSIIPYLPFATVRNLSREGRLPRTEFLKGGVLFIDVAGFTSMCLSLAAHGPRGIQALQEIMSGYYGDLLKYVRGFGGVVYQFAGDSVLVGMRKEPDESDAAVAERTARCVLDIHGAVASFTDFQALGQNYAIHTKVGAAFGEYRQVVLGRREHILHPVLLGDAVTAAVGAEAHAQGGQSVLTGNLREHLPAHTEVSQTESGADYFVLRRMSASGDVPADRSSMFQMSFDFDEDKVYQRCARFLPDALIKKITTGHQGFTGALRNITCLFLRFDAVHAMHAGRRAMDELGSFFSYVQSKSRDSGGLFLQTDFTDKGGMFLLLFGAPTALENKEVAAVRLALSVLQDASNFPAIQDPRMGIATGDAYCGDLGAPFRKCYSVLGENVNLAARISARSGSSVRMDAATRARLPDGFQLDAPELHSFKGIDEPRAVYTVRGETSTNLTPDSGGTKLIGREAELNFLREHLERTLEGRGRLITIVGEAGLGKSHLAAVFAADMSSRDMRSLVGHCYGHERRTPFFPWKQILADLLQFDPTDSVDARLHKIELALEPLDDVSPEWSLVFAGALGLPVVEDSSTRALEPRERNLRLFQIIFTILARGAQEQALCLYFEDGHWLDDSSVRLIQYITGRIREQSILILVALRPDPVLAELMEADELTGGDTPRVELRLEHLADDAAREFLRRHMRLARENSELEDNILSVAQGNPFFIEAIVDGLLEAGHIRGETRELVTRVKKIPLPNSLRDVLLVRLDNLDEDAQTTLKTASVIGRIFAFDNLRILLPRTLDSELARSSLSSLENMELMHLETASPLAYMFKHIAIRDAAYESLLLSTREQIHVRLAEHLEKVYAETIREHSEILAYHFHQGRKYEQALEYSILAGDKARENYANRDAVAYYEQAREILKQGENRRTQGKDLSARVSKNLAEVRSRIGDYDAALSEYRECLHMAQDALTRARIHMGIGLIHQERGEPQAAVVEMEYAMKLLGRRPPRTRAGTIFSLLGQFAVRFAYEKFPWIIKDVSESERGQSIELLRALRILQKIYFMVDLERFAWSGAYGTNLAERVGDTDELVQLQAVYGTILNGMGRREAGRAYLEKALHLIRTKGSSNPLIEGLILQLNGTRYMFWEDPAGGLELLDESIRINRRAGGIWELLTSLGTQGQLLFLLSRFRESAEKYEQCGELARELSSTVHLAWMYCKAPFARYLISEPDAESRQAVREALRQAVELSIRAEDLMNHMIALAHLSVIARHEGNLEEAARLAVEILEINQRYKVNLPHVKIALVEAADAALDAGDHARTHGERMNGLDAEALFRLAAQAVKKARRLGRTFPYLRGPAERVRARYTHLRKGPQQARRMYENAVDILKDSRHPWETGLAYLDAARAYPSKHEKHRRYLQQAKSIFQEHGIRAETARMERRSGS